MYIFLAFSGWLPRQIEHARDDVVEGERNSILNVWGVRIKSVACFVRGLQVHNATFPQPKSGWEDVIYICRFALYIHKRKYETEKRRKSERERERDELGDILRKEESLSPESLRLCYKRARREALSNLFRVTCNNASENVEKEETLVLRSLFPSSGFFSNYFFIFNSNTYTLSHFLPLLFRFIVVPFNIFFLFAPPFPLFRDESDRKIFSALSKYREFRRE